MDVRKTTTYLPVSDEVLAEEEAARAAVQAYLTATPEQRAEWGRRGVKRRRVERETAEPVTLTVESLLDKLGWSREYAEHVVQPYCDCGDGYDGWSKCSHAHDLGLWD